MSDDGGAFDPKAYVAELSHRPGVYRMQDADGKVIYVGKARDLRKRVATYFSGKAKDAKTMAMVERVAGIEVTLTKTESEALLLEHTLIKRHRPRFNILLRDDKSYPWIRVSTEHAFPRLSFYRGSRKGKAAYYGPYPSAGAVKNTLNELQKLFRVRQCRDSFYANRSRPCLQYQIKRCSGPCVGLITPEDYARDVEDSVAFLQGRNSEVIERLVVRMEAAAEKLDFEQAARLRDQVSRLRRIETEQRVSTRGDADADIIGLHRSEGVTCVAVLIVRDGRVLGSRTYLPANAAGVEDAAVISAFFGPVLSRRRAAKGSDPAHSYRGRRCARRSARRARRPQGRHQAFGARRSRGLAWHGRRQRHARCAARVSQSHGHRQAARGAR